MLYTRMLYIKTTCKMVEKHISGIATVMKAQTTYTYKKQRGKRAHGYKQSYKKDIINNQRKREPESPPPSTVSRKTHASGGTNPTPAPTGSWKNNNHKLPW